MNFQLLLYGIPYIFALHDEETYDVSFLLDSHDVTVLYIFSYKELAILLGTRI